jgi:uncharacterized protein YjbI with pentapeptide repeats
MLVEETRFTPQTKLPTWGAAVFRFCEFEDLSIDGNSVDGALLWCQLTNVEWYWGLFNTAVIAQTKFNGCTFRGTSFRSCQFVACEFDRCRFVLDNLASECTFSDCSFVECSFNQCEFVLDSPSGRPVFINTRWYGCTQARCDGLDAQF